MPVWSRPSALAALQHLGWRLGHTPTQQDLLDNPGEAPSRMWWYRNYPGGWLAAIHDVFSVTARPGHNTYQAHCGGGPGFRDPANLAKAMAARTTNTSFNQFGQLVNPEGAK